MNHRNKPMGTEMTMKLATRLLPVLLVAAAAVAVPGDAYAAISNSAASAWWDEILIGLAVVAGMVLVDMSSWSLMTKR